MRWLEKIKNKNGEALTETLAAMLIMVMAFTILPGAIITSANANKAARTNDVDWDEDGNIVEAEPTSVDGKLTVTLHHEGDPDIEVNYKNSDDGNKYLTKTDDCYRYTKVSQ